MISRYSRKELVSIWSEENKYKIWLDVEIAAAEAMEKYKIIPKGVSKKVRKKAKINPKRILEIEKKVKHDVIAFLTSISEKVGNDAKYLHKGMTSSDVLDTCLNLQLKQSGEILIKDLVDAKVVIKGCGNLKSRDYAFFELTKKLTPIVSSIMYGEPCSTVPVYKRRK